MRIWWISNFQLHKFEILSKISKWLRLKVKNKWRPPSLSELTPYWIAKYVKSKFIYGILGKPCKIWTWKNKFMSKYYNFFRSLWSLQVYISVIFPTGKVFVNLLKNTLEISNKLHNMCCNLCLFFISYNALSCRYSKKYILLSMHLQWIELLSCSQ